MAKLTPEQVVEKIRASMREGRVELDSTFHARSRMIERGIEPRDMRHVLATGIIYDEPMPAKESGLWRYKIEATIPSSGNRRIAAIIIPDKSEDMLYIKVVTVMWVNRT